MDNFPSSFMLKVLKLVIPENEGLVISADDSYLKSFINSERAILYNMDGQLCIMEDHQGFLEGQRIVIE